mmetsp:Transcript_22240/g.35760  ORF Transcript_22240/g.35760 Transcript_22240/m.35760 type:complete len:211 (+) Transcript_22240:34-666(+)
MDGKDVHKNAQPGEEMKTVEPKINIKSTSLVRESTKSYLMKTVTQFKRNPSVPNLHSTAQRKYATFCRNRTAELYTTFLGLVGYPDFGKSKFIKEFKACVPFPGKTNERTVGGMAKDGFVMHGVVRYAYKGNLIEECRKNGKEHGLRVVCTQMGDIWIRLFSNGKRLAQVVLSADCKVAANPKPIDDGGLKGLMSHLHLILECFEVKQDP